MPIAAHFEIAPLRRRQKGYLFLPTSLYLIKSEPYAIYLQGVASNSISYGTYPLFCENLHDALIPFTKSATMVSKQLNNQ